MKENQYIEKEEDYFSHVRMDAIELIPMENRNGNMLEIGAADGSTLLYCKKNAYAKNITGVELCKIEGSLQESTDFDAFIIGDIESLDLQFSENSFDVILCLDVLEHLVDPSALLHKVKTFLKDDGVLITSVPNIRELVTMVNIFLRGDFKYTDSGVLDRTHLRFFCKKNIIELFLDNGFRIVKITDAKNGKRWVVNRLTFGLFEEFITAQYYTVLRK